MNELDYYIVNFFNVDSTQTKNFVYTLEDVYLIIRRLDHEGATWNVEKVSYVTKDVRRELCYEELPR